MARVVRVFLIVFLTASCGATQGAPTPSLSAADQPTSEPSISVAPNDIQSELESVEENESLISRRLLALSQKSPLHEVAVISLLTLRELSYLPFRSGTHVQIERSAIELSYDRDAVSEWFRTAGSAGRGLLRDCVVEAMHPDDPSSVHLQGDDRLMFGRDCLEMTRQAFGTAGLPVLLDVASQVSSEPNAVALARGALSEIRTLAADNRWDDAPEPRIYWRMEVWDWRQWSRRNRGRLSQAEADLTMSTLQTESANNVMRDCVRLFGTRLHNDGLDRRAEHVLEQYLTTRSSSWLAWLHERSLDLLDDAVASGSAEAAYTYRLWSVVSARTDRREFERHVVPVLRQAMVRANIAGGNAATREAARTALTRGNAIGLPVVSSSL
ncbi:MAG: hypothetical protein KC561_16965 [Myxococcales bacterium]|nr:hypothetical protein [Myxococcales bacterium]